MTLLSKLFGFSLAVAGITIGWGENAKQYSTLRDGLCNG
jgi:hypothetical protein